jgi:gamma-glutamyltranspeptidase/glutathione hydrolase
MLPDMGSSSEGPIGATVTGGLETRAERDDLAGKKLALEPSDASFAGAVVADEPMAALIARGILENGGNAADAATALYFALSVTYPASAGLGGGGVCLVRDADHIVGKTSKKKKGVKKLGEVESIAFLTRRPRDGGPFAIPGNVRGFALLQARHGVLPWGELVSPAERIAGTGFSVSRAAAHRLNDASVVIAASPDLATLYARSDGKLYQETDLLSQVALATTLAHIRARGVDGFYRGETGKYLVDQARAKGGALDPSDLTDYRPEIASAQQIEAGDVAVALPAKSLGAGAFANALWTNVQSASGAEALAAAAERTAVALGAPGGAALDSDFGSTSFAVVDSKGGAVACAVTMNGAFGAGRVAEGTGVVFASSPETKVKGLGSAFLVPVMVLNPDTKELYIAGAGAGAPKGGAAIEGAVKAAVTTGGDTAVAALTTGPADLRSPANAIICPDGLPAGVCTLNPNPKGEGVGFGAVSSGSNSNGIFR